MDINYKKSSEKDLNVDARFIFNNKIIIYGNTPETKEASNKIFVLSTNNKDLFIYFGIGKIVSYINNKSSEINKKYIYLVCLNSKDLENSDIYPSILKLLDLTIKY